MMKQKNHRKAIAAILAATFCIGMVLSGCGTDKSGTENQQSSETPDETADLTGGGQSITDEDRTQTSVQDQETQTVPAQTGTATGNEAQAADTAKQDEPEADYGNLYEQFLHNEVQATVSNSFPEADYGNPVVQNGTSYTLTELGECVSGYYLNPEYTDKTSYDSIQYTYVECPDSASADERNLLVKFIGLNIYSPDDDSYAVFVITEDNGQLYVTDTYECWARSAADACANGTLISSGSGGAGNHYAGLEVILSNGSRAAVYDAEVLSGWWTNYVNNALFNEVFGDDVVLENFVVIIYTVGDGKYYQYDMSNCPEEEKILCEDYITRCQEEQGISWVTDDEIQTAIKNRCAALGVDYAVTTQQPETTWNNL